MTRQSVKQNHQQLKSNTYPSSSILQRTAIRSVSEEVEIKALQESHFCHDFSQIPVHTISSSVIQAKLKIGDVGDKYEQEADRLARQVVSQINAPDSQIQREQMPEDDEELQMKPIMQRQTSGGAMAATSDLEASIQRLRGSGQPLAQNIRKPMEQAFGADFSGVKVHTNAQSDQLNQSIQARAFTTRQDIFFRHGQFNPESRSGQELIAHELTHVMQQNGSAVQSQGENKKFSAAKGNFIDSQNKSNFTYSGEAIQLVKLTIAENQTVRQNANTRKAQWPEEQGVNKLIAWAKSEGQINSILMNYTYQEWTAVKKVFPDSSILGAKVAQIKPALEAKKVEIKAQAIILFRQNYGKGMSVQDAIKENLITLQHNETFRTVKEKQDKKGHATGPATREWLVFVGDEQANWVLHIHYDDVTTKSTPAGHVKPWATRRDANSQRFFAKELEKRVTINSVVDQASADLSAFEKTKL
jgi:Domain of unknown function (DUF4157)